MPGDCLFVFPLDLQHEREISLGSNNLATDNGKPSKVILIKDRGGTDAKQSWCIH